MTPTLETALIISLCVLVTIVILRHIALIGAFLFLMGASLLFVICSPLILFKKITNATKGAGKSGLH